MQRELDVYSEYKTILGDTLSKKYLPDIYYFDSKLYCYVQYKSPDFCCNVFVVLFLHMSHTLYFY
jgi:hypothetical protein